MPQDAVLSDIATKSATIGGKTVVFSPDTVFIDETIPSDPVSIDFDGLALLAENDPNVFVNHEGRRIYFCRPGCKDTFKKHPGKYLSKLDAAAEPKPG